VLQTQYIEVYIPQRALERNLKALCTVRVNGWTINGFKIVQLRDDQNPFVLFPSFSRLNRKTGKVEWHEVIDFPPLERVELREAVLSAYRRKLRREGNGERRFSTQAP